jgi:8-oxo-dGTP diphosphatase
VFLVRHANAGSRSRWKGDDGLRPLSAKGRRQADDIATNLARASIARIASSPATRCIETVAPLAHALGIEVETDERLAEGADPGAAVDLVLGATKGLVLCAHGDVIPAVMTYLVGQGMKAKAPARCQKASVWAIEVRKGAAVEAFYTAPPTPR